MVLKSISKYKSILFILLFALIGVIYIFYVKAAIFSVAIEVENGTPGAGVCVKKTDDSSAGQHISFAQVCDFPTNLDTLRIATLGDSNTANIAWRTTYQNRLKAQNCSYDMLGQFGDEVSPDPNYDWNTDAKGGSAIGIPDASKDIFRLGESTVGTKPDIIIIIAGTNNVGWGEQLWNGDTTETFLGRHINNLRNELSAMSRTSPDSLILLGAIPHSNLSPNFVPRFNNMQQQLVDQMRADQKNILFWNAQTNSGDVQTDGVHLNSSGAAKYGNAAFFASQDFINSSGACNR